MDVFNSLLSEAPSLGSAVYDLGQILLIVSMSMRNFTMLRILAVASGSLSLIYRTMVVPDPVSVFWQTLFLTVNLVQLLILWSERLRAPLSDDEEFFISHVIPGVHRTLARRLVRIANFRRVERDVLLTEEGKVVPELIFILAGSAEARSNSEVLGHCRRGEFVGEMSIVTGNAASADVIAETPVSYLAFERAALMKVLSASNDLRRALEAGFNRSLVDKLVQSNKGLLADPDMSLPR